MSKTLIETIDFAAKKHTCQRRKNKEQTPYINHPIGVARILTAEANIDDIIVLQAALLHDTIEDTDTSYEELKEKFGIDVANVVMEVTDDKNLPGPDRKRLQIETAPTKSDRAKLVKMADKIYNLRDLATSTPIGWTEDRVRGYFIWAQKVTNGCKGVNQNMEDILAEIYSGCFTFEGKTCEI